MAEEQKKIVNTNTNDGMENQENSKTIVAFIVGLLIGGILVWVFTGDGDGSDKDRNQDSKDNAAVTEEVGGENDEGNEVDDSVTDNEATEPTDEPVLAIGDGNIVVNDQAASSLIAIESATYPLDEGWIGVRDYNNGQLGFILGVVRFSQSNGTVPENIALQRSTTAGQQYAVVVFSEDGVSGFNPAGDVQISEIFATFTAQ